MNSRLRAWLVLVLLLAFRVSAAETLRVVTINVWSGLDYKGSLKMGEYESRETRETRYRVLVSQLKALDPDVVALNEANMLPRYARRLAGDLGYDCVYHVGLGGLRAGPVGLPVNLREGDALLARKSLHLRKAGRRQLSGGPVGSFFAFHFADATQVVGARIEVAGEAVFIFATHWHASPFTEKEGQLWRMEEARKTLEFVRRAAGSRPAMLLGDFNALADSEEIKLLLEDGFVDAYAAVRSDPGPTWDEERNTNIITYYRPTEPRRDRIDFVFVRGQAIRVLDAQVVLDRIVEGLHPSDHFGVLAELEIAVP